MQRSQNNFLEFIRYNEMEDDKMMISLYVTSPYTTVPTKDLLRIMSDFLRKDKDTVESR